MLQHRQPNPPTDPSSTVTSTEWCRASCSNSAVSSGFANRASATVAGRPRAASSSAARSASANRVPSDRIATGPPSRSTRPRPSSSTSPRAPASATPRALAARVAQRARPVVDRRRRRHHVHELRLVRRRHQHHPRQAAEIGEVEAPRMGRPVRAHQTRPVHREPHGQALDRDVVHHLVVGALQERRIDGAERPQALGRHARPRTSPRAARRCRHRSTAPESASRTGPARCRTASPP